MASSPINDDEAARQKAANPLTTYFGGSQGTQPGPSAAPPAPAPPASSGSSTTKGTPGAGGKPTNVPTTNVGNGANTGTSNTGNAAQPASPYAGWNAQRPAAPAMTAPTAPPPVRTLQPRTLPQAGPTQAPTDFVNFQRYFNANKDASTAAAQRLAGSVGQSATDAASKLAASQADFNSQVAAGSVGAAPDMGSSTDPSNPGQPDDATAADSNAGQPDPNALTSESTKNGGLSAADMAAKAAGTYTGPGGLGDIASSQAAADAAAKAGGQLGATQTTGGVQALLDTNAPQGANTSAFSSGLVSSAGQDAFGKLRAAFNPQQNFADASTADAKAATDAAATSATNAAAWAKDAGIKGTQDQQQAAFDQAQAKAATDKLSAAAQAADARMPTTPYEAQNQPDTPANRTAYMMQGVDPNDIHAVQARQAQIRGYMNAQEMTTQNQMDQTFGDINAVLSPSAAIAEASGNKDQTQAAAQNQYNKGGISSASGSTSQSHIPWDKAGVDGFFVWRQMSPDDWNQLNKLPARSSFGNDQIAWITRKGQQLRAAQGSQQAAPAVGRSQG